MRLGRSFTSSMNDEIDAYDSPTSTLRRSWSNTNLTDMESRYRRGASEERYPAQYRGRSPSPFEYRNERARSLEPERYDRESSPVREVVPYRHYSDVPRYEIPRPYSDYYYYRPYSDFYYYDRPYPYYYRPTPPIYPTYDPRPRYDYYNYHYRPSYPIYTYPKPSYSRLSPETLRAIAGLTKPEPEKYFTPRDRSSYTTKPYESYSLTSPSYTKTFSTYTSKDHLVYNPAKYRSYFAHPIKRGRSRDLMEVKTEGASEAAATE